ncbi:MAG: redoxin family protein [Myxococcota bacterium]
MTLLLSAQLFALSACTAADPTARAVTPAAAPTAKLVGEPAPAFTLKDLGGAEVSLAAYRGKTVVLEWFNPGCPFVVASHTKGSLVGAAARHPEVVWLAVNSSAPGKEGHALEVNQEATRAWSLGHPVLRDEAGVVGKAYGATNTPQMVVIDPGGVVRYAGAIDNAPDGEGRRPTGGALVNFVDQALAELAAGKPVSVSATQPYGCGVKYAQ